jgi:hypothetical protein
MAEEKPEAAQEHRGDRPMDHQESNQRAFTAPPAPHFEIWD